MRKCEWQLGFRILTLLFLLREPSRTYNKLTLGKTKVHGGKVGHYLLLMFNPLKVSSTVQVIKSIC